MAKNLPNLMLAEAGPGAGKTHAMVDEIIAAIKKLPPHRFLAAITYTNAAANTIRERLCRRVQLRNNIFIGTTHSFMIRFVLAPYAELLSLLPEDCIYAPIDVHEKGRGAVNYTKNLIKKGIVPYEAIITITQEILKKPNIRDRICGRLAYIFIDEFQDTDNRMFEIFQHFFKEKKTDLFVVGDPEQYVMSFTYHGRRPPKFNQIPFFRLKEQTESEQMIKNHRSNGEIVTFANQFRKDLQQQAVKPNRSEPRVLFIPATSLEEIIRRFQALSSNVEIEEAPRTRLYLSEENQTFNSVLDKFKLTPISNVAQKKYTLLGEALELISKALGRSQRKICEEFELSRLQWRAVGIRLLRYLHEDEYNTDRFFNFVKDEFDQRISDSRIKNTEDSLSILRNQLSKKGLAQLTEFCASIRKAKGLQADAALVVAKSVAELQKWLQNDLAARMSDKQDKCRLGYIAFTRPREMLCIACLKEIDAELIHKLQNLRIVTVIEDDAEKSLDSKL